MGTYHLEDMEDIFTEGSNIGRHILSRSKGKPEVFAPGNKELLYLGISTTPDI